MAALAEAPKIVLISQGDSISEAESDDIIADICDVGGTVKVNYLALLSTLKSTTYPGLTYVLVEGGALEKIV